MLQLVPARLASRDRGAARALLVTPRDMASRPFRVTLARRQRGRTRDIGAFTLDAAAIGAVQTALGTGAGMTILRLPPALLLDREVVLPLAAEADPARVLGYEMDRLTPFAAPEVFWTYAVQRRDRAKGRLHVRLSLIAKAPLRDLLADLERAGIVPAVLEVAQGDAPACRIDLRARHAPPSRAARALGQVMAALCGGLALAAVALPFVLQSRDIARVEAEIATLRPQVDAAEAIRRRIAARAAGTDVIAAERGRLGDTLAVLAALTDLLPDDTFLTDLALRAGKLTLNGQSAAAVRLIAALSADPVIRNPDFAAPVTRLQDGKADQFAIRAEIAP